jgi:hypothetical protein
VIPYRLLRWMMRYHVRRENGLIYFWDSDGNLRVFLTESELDDARRSRDTVLEKLNGWQRDDQARKRRVEQ